MLEHKDRIAAYFQAAEDHRKAKLRYSREWQLAYYASKDSWAANQVATEKTNAELVVTEAALKVAEKELDRDS